MTLGAALVLGTHGVVAKLLALPEFILVVALARLAGAALTARRWPTVRLLLIAKVVLLIAVLRAGGVARTVPQIADAPAALATGFAGVAAMAVQNAVQRVHLGGLPSSTLISPNTTRQAVLDAVDLMRGADPDQAPAVRARFRRMLMAMAGLAAGRAVAAALYPWLGIWCLAVPAAGGAASAIPAVEDRASLRVCLRSTASASPPRSTAWSTFVS